MKKTFHYLAGIHRSGNTLLSSILNQHSKIYSSPLGPMAEYISNIRYNNHQMVHINTFEYRKKQLISQMLDAYYSDVEKPIIIDRDKYWGTPNRLEIIKTCINPNPKIIYTIRPIEEVISSMIAINSKRIMQQMNPHNWKNNKTLSDKDNICEFLMSPNGSIMRSLETIKSIQDPTNKGMFHVVSYDDLIMYPENTMNNIYDFLEIEAEDHDFTNIFRIEKYNEEAAGLPEDMHEVRKTLSKRSIDVNEYVSDYIKEKYSYINDLFLSIQNK